MPYHNPDTASGTPYFLDEVPNDKRLAFIESDYSNYDRVLDAETVSLYIQYLTRGVPTPPKRKPKEGLFSPSSLNYYFRKKKA